MERDRLTDGITLQLLRLELKRAIKPVLIILAGLIAAGFGGYYIINNINGGIGGTHTMRFAVVDATGVVPGRAEVRFKGIEAGTIGSADLVDGHAVLTVSVANKFGPVYRNAQADLRPNTPLEDMYLDIVNRGTKSAGAAPSNYIIPISQTQSPVDLADVLNVFQPGVRAHLYDLIDQLGNGLADRGADLRQAFIDFTPFLRIAGQISDQLARRSDLTKLLIHNAATLSTLLGSRSQQLHTLVTDGAETLQAAATDAGTPLQQTIHELPPTFTDLQSTLTNFDALLPSLNSAVTKLKPVVDTLPSGLTNLREFARSAEPALTRLQQPVEQLVPLANQLQPFSDQLAGSLKNIEPQVPDVNDVTLPLSHCMRQVGYFWLWDESMTKFFDSQGQMVRGNAQFGFYTDTTLKPGYSLVNPVPCAGGTTLSGAPTPKDDGPAPAP